MKLRRYEIVLGCGGRISLLKLKVALLMLLVRLGLCLRKWTLVV